MGNGASADAVRSFSGHKVGASAALRDALSMYPGMTSQQRQSMFKHHHTPKGGFRHAKRRPPRLQHLGSDKVAHAAVAAAAEAAAKHKGVKRKKSRSRKGKSPSAKEEDNAWSNVRAMAHRRRNHQESGAEGRKVFGRGHPLHHSASAQDVEMYHIMKDAGQEHGNFEANPLEGVKERQLVRSGKSGRFKIEKTDIAKRAKRVVESMIRTRESLRWKSLESKINQRRAKKRINSAGSRASKPNFSASQLLDNTFGAYSNGYTKSSDVDSDSDSTSSDGNDSRATFASAIVASPIRAAATAGEPDSATAEHHLPAITSPISRRIMSHNGNSQSTLPLELQTDAQKRQQQRQHASLLASMRGERFSDSYASGSLRKASGTATNSPSKQSQSRKTVAVPASVAQMRNFLSLPRSVPHPGTEAAAARQYFVQIKQQAAAFAEASSRSYSDATAAAGHPTDGAHDAHDDGAALAHSAAKIDEWACKVCTFINPHIMEICEMCETRRADNVLGSTDAPLNHQRKVHRAASLDSSLPLLGSSALASLAHDAPTSPSRIGRVELHGATPTSLFLMWDAPATDGGAAIVGFVLECRKGASSDAASGSRQRWQRVYFGIERNYLATNLLSESAYDFRVTSINAEGLQVGPCM